MNKFMARVDDIAKMRAPLVHACSLFKSRAVSVLGYVAQIATPPKSFKTVELRVANKILRLATNSFSTNCAYQLESLHGPKLERPVVHLHACMVRCAAKTLHGFSQQHETLLQEVIYIYIYIYIYMPLCPRHIGCVESNGLASSL
jgi:hypothetical protein